MSSPEATGWSLSPRTVGQEGQRCKHFTVRSGVFLNGATRWLRARDGSAGRAAACELHLLDVKIISQSHNVYSCDASITRWSDSDDLPKEEWQGCLALVQELLQLAEFRL